MIDRRPRSSYESDWLPYTTVTARSAVRVAIGQALSSRYEVPRDLLHELLGLLTSVFRSSVRQYGTPPAKIGGR